MNYEDIIHLNRPKSLRKKMTMASRASQFAPFAALSGHEEAINETSRLTCNDVELSVDQKQDLDYVLASLNPLVSTVCVNYFVLDEKKAGGSIQKYEGIIKKIDEMSRTLVFIDGTIIPIQDVRSLSEV